MRFFLQLPVIRVLHARGLLLLTSLLVLVGAVLISGALHRQRLPTESEASEPLGAVPFAPTFPTFRPDLEKTPLTYMSDYWRQLGDRVKPMIVLLGSERTPALVVAPGVALSTLAAADEVISQIWLRQASAGMTSALEPPGTSTTTPEPESAAPTWSLADGQVPPPTLQPGPHKLTAIDSANDLSLFELDEATSTPWFTLVDPSSLHPGSFVAAVTLASDGQVQIVPGYLVSVRTSELSGEGDPPFELSFRLPASLRAAAIVDLDGALVGLAVQTSHGYELLSSNAVLDIVERLRESPRCLSIEVSDLTEEARRLLGIGGGVLVESVREDAFAQAPTIRPGDVLLEWNRQKTDNAEQFEQQYAAASPGGLIRYVVLRDRRRVSGTTEVPGPDCRPVEEPLAPFARLGLMLRWGTRPGDERETVEGWSVIGVVPGSPAAIGGVQEHDWIVAADGLMLDRTSGPRVFARFEQRSQPMLLTVRRGDRATLVTVTPVKE